MLLQFGVIYGSVCCSFCSVRGVCCCVRIWFVILVCIDKCDILHYEVISLGMCCVVVWVVMFGLSHRVLLVCLLRCVMMWLVGG